MLRATLWLIVGILPVLGQMRTTGEAGPAAPRTAAGGDVATLPPPSVALSLPDHKISPNDLIQISVFDEPQLSKSMRVGSDGTIVMPLLKSGLRVEGLLPRELEAALEQDLIDQQILVHPIVSVSILEYATRLISVVGAVKNPGQFPVTGPVTLLEAMAKAGWANSDAGQQLLLTRSDSEAPRKINIAELLQASTDSTVNVVLSGGEVINIPEAARIWVTGNVSKPQAVAVKNPADATVLKILANVEGLTQYYAKTAYIYRPDLTGVRREISIPLKDMMHRKAKDVPLMADDILLIPDDNGTKRRAILQELASLGGIATSAVLVTGLR